MGGCPACPLVPWPLHCSAPFPPVLHACTGSSVDNSDEAASSEDFFRSRLGWQLEAVCCASKAAIAPRRGSQGDTSADGSRNEVAVVCCGGRPRLAVPASADSVTLLGVRQLEHQGECCQLLGSLKLALVSVLSAFFEDAACAACRAPLCLHTPAHTLTDGDDRCRVLHHLLLIAAHCQALPESASLSLRGLKGMGLGLWVNGMHRYTCVSVGAPEVAPRANPS